RLLQRPDCCAPGGHEHVRRERNKVRRVFANVVGVASGPAIVQLQVAAFGPAELLQSLNKRLDAYLGFRIALYGLQQHADAPHTLALLCARCQWPNLRGRHRTACVNDKFASPHCPHRSTRRHRIFSYKPAERGSQPLFTTFMSAWVESGSKNPSLRCLLYPRKRTLNASLLMSAKCQEPTSRVADPHRISALLLIHAMGTYLIRISGPKRQKTTKESLPKPRGYPSLCDALRPQAL